MKTENTLDNINPYVLGAFYINNADNTPYARRREKWYEVELILKGSGHIIFNNVTYPITGPCIYFREPGAVVQGFPPYACYLISFDLIYNQDREPDYVNGGIWDSLATMPNKPCSGLPFKPYINNIRLENYIDSFTMAYNAFITGGRKNQFILKTCLMQILLRILQERNPSEKNNPTKSQRLISTYGQRLNLLIKMLNDNISKKFTLEELANSIGLSPNFLCKIFKQYTGQTIIEYINSKRIGYAKRLLLETDLPLKQIVTLCGFENQNYFFEVFKKEEGITPSAYKNTYRFE